MGRSGQSRGRRRVAASPPGSTSCRHGPRPCGGQCVGLVERGRQRSGHAGAPCRGASLLSGADQSSTAEEEQAIAVVQAAQPRRTDDQTAQTTYPAPRRAGRAKISKQRHNGQTAAQRPSKRPSGPAKRGCSALVTLPTRAVVRTTRTRPVRAHGTAELPREPKARRTSDVGPVEAELSTAREATSPTTRSASQTRHLSVRQRPPRSSSVSAALAAVRDERAPSHAVARLLATLGVAATDERADERKGETQTRSERERNANARTRVDRTFGLSTAETWLRPTERAKDSARAGAKRSGMGSDIRGPAAASSDSEPGSQLRDERVSRKTDAEPM